MKKVSIEVPDKVYDVANALRRSYYEDEMKDLVGSKVPLQWIRMAEAAIKEFEKRPAFFPVESPRKIEDTL